MEVSLYSKLAYRIFGRATEREARRNTSLRSALLRSQTPLRPEMYISRAYLTATIAFVASALSVVGLVAVWSTGVLAIPPTALVLLVPLPVVLAGTLYIVSFVAPDLRAAERARDIDARLPYALNYISTMANAGVPPDRIFASLAKQHLYGEVANEAAWISRDLNVLAQDLPSALAAAIDRSPSIHFQDFLQGAITAVSSGGKLKTYFLTKSEQFMRQAQEDQKKFLETLGILAESFVTMVVAAPIFLIILITVMAMFGDGGGTLGMGYLLVLVLLPLAHGAFLAAIAYVTPEV